MSGHSKYANTKHRKNAQDARRSKTFSRLNREITVAVREGGENPEQNPRLRLAIQTARGHNMPKDSIERAIRRASGAGGTTLRSAIYEGFGPRGVAIVVEVLTDNTNRTTSFLRSTLGKSGGGLGSVGCHDRLFDRRGVFECPKLTEDDLLALVDAGLEDWSEHGDAVRLFSRREDFGSLASGLEGAGITPVSAGLAYVPTLIRTVDDGLWAALMLLVEALESNDDVVRTYHNAAH